MGRSELAGKKPPPEILVDVARLVTAYYTLSPDPAEPSQRVAFGTSGHRGSAFHRAFNEAHILATTQAICEVRAADGVSGPLYLGIDTHALSEPARASALEVLAANGVAVVLQEGMPIRRLPSSRTRSSPGTAAGPRASPTASSSRPRTIHPRTAASSTTRRPVGPPTPRRPSGSRSAPTSSSASSSTASAAFPSSERSAPRVARTSRRATSPSSPRRSISMRSAPPASGSAWTPSGVPRSRSGIASPSATGSPSRS